MVIALLAIFLGVAVGFFLPFQLSAISSLYISVGILAAIDSILGAIRANLMNEFDPVIFLSGFFVNVFLAVGLSYLGDNLGVPIYYAAVFVFGTRIFNNMGSIRRETIDRYRMKKSNKIKENS